MKVIAIPGTVAAFGLLVVASRAQSSDHVINSYKAQRPIELNGDLSAFKNADSVTFSGRPLAGSERRATVYTLWDKDYLYLAFDVHSSKLQASVRQHDGQNLWYDDGVEFLIDPHRHRTKEFLPDDFSYHINILNAVWDDRGTPSGKPDEKWNGNARHTVKILDDHHYVIEAAIPWSEIGVQPVADSTAIGIDFCVNGKDPATGQYDYFDWCSLKVFHDPSGFGELRVRGQQP